MIRLVDVDDTTGSHSGLPIAERRAHPRCEDPSWYVTLWKRFWSLASTSDTAPSQFFLFMCASLVAGTLLLAGDSLSRPTYRYLYEAAGAHADEKWACLFIIFAVAELWNTLTFGHPKTSLVINLLGVALFTSIPIAAYWEPSQPPPLIGPLSVSVALVAGWVAVLTNNKPARGWRSD